MKKLYNFIMLVIFVCLLVFAYNIYQDKQREYRESERRGELKRNEEVERLKVERERKEEYRKQLIFEEAERKRKAEEEVRIKQEQADAVKVGNDLVKESKYEDAILKFNRAIELGVTDAGIYNSLGISYEKLGKTQEALSYYKKALEINPDFKEASVNIKSIEYQVLKNQITEEIKILTETLQRNQTELEKYQIAEINKKITELQATLNRSYYDLQTAKGLVVYESRWVTPEEKVKLEDEKKKSEEAKKTAQDYTPLAKAEPVKTRLYRFTNDKSGLVNLVLNLVPQPPGADVTYDTTYQSLLVTNTQANLKPVDEIVGKSDNPAELQGTIEKLLWANGRYQNSRYGFQIEKPDWGLTTTFTVPGSVVSPPYGATCQFGMTLQVGKSNIRFLVYQLKEPVTSQDYALARKNHPEPEFANGWIDNKKGIFRDGAFFGIKDSYRTTGLWSTGQKEFICSRVHLVKGHTLYEIVQICTPEDYQKTEEQTLISFVKCLKFFQSVIPDKRVRQESITKSITKVTISEGDPYKKDLEIARAHVEKKDFTKAIQILEQVVVKKDAGTRGEEALFQIGYIRGFCLNEYDSGIKVFEEFKKLYPKSTSIEQAYRSIALLYFKKNDYKTAEERFMELLEKYPTKETANFIKHYLYVMKNCKEKRI